MSLTRGGDPGKTVVYTDRELSRPLLAHFGNHRDDSVGGDKTRFGLEEPTGGPLALPGPPIPHPQDLHACGELHIGRATSVAGEDCR